MSMNTGLWQVAKLIPVVFYRVPVTVLRMPIVLSDRVFVFMCTAKLKCAKKYASSMADLAVS